MQNELRPIFKNHSAREIEHELFDKITDVLHQKYGANPDERVSNRVEREWRAIERCGLATDIAALYEIVEWLKANRHPYWMRSCTGSSFILYLLGITFGNPLPAHTLCPKCKSITWYARYADGFDIPRDYVCEKDNTTVVPDGHNIPWQPLFGYGEYSPVLQIDLTKNTYEYLQEALASHWIATIDKDNPLTCSVRTEGTERKCIDVSNLALRFVLNQEEISPLFYEKNASAWDYETIVENWIHYVNYDSSDENERMVEYNPNTVADVIALMGLLHSAGAWDEVTKMMVSEMCYSYSDLICFRDDVFAYLLDHDFLEMDAWRGMESARKGKHLPFFNEEMLAARDRWVFSRLGLIKYLFPKAHAVENLIFRLRANRK